MTGKFKKIAIIGVGLIGGSIGLCVRKNKLAQEVVGVGRRWKSIEAAVKKGAIHKGRLDLEKGVKEAELVIVATPIEKIIDISKEALQYLPHGGILMDVGSTKLNIVSEIQKGIPSDKYYVGTHPLAGSEKSGVEYAEDSIFKDACCIITPVKKSSEEVISKIEEFWKNLGSKTFLMSPELHDEIISNTSHIPHLIAAILVQNSKDYLEFTGGSFRDATRVALSDPKMWEHIFIENKKYILKDIKNIILELEKFFKLIKNEEREELRNLLESIMLKRKGLYG